METLQPTLRLGRDVWDRGAMPVDEFVVRASRLRAAISERGLDVLLLYGRDLNGCGDPTYLSNYIVKLPFAALVVLPAEGEPALIFEGATRGRTAAQATTWIDDVRPCWNMAETCLAVLSDRGLASATIGLAGLPDRVPHATWSAIATGLPHSRFVDARDIVERQRMIKSSRELAQIHRASAIVATALRLLPAGNETGLAAHVIRAARLQGAEDIRLMLSRGEVEEWTFRPPESRHLNDGDRVSISLSASWERYWSEAMRTYVVRGDRLESTGSAESDAHVAAMVGAMKPGALVSDWAQSTTQAMTGIERQALRCCGLGHGIGITPQEAPILSPAEPRAFSTGMSLVLRLAVVTDGGVTLHGETVAI